MAGNRKLRTEDMEGFDPTLDRFERLVAVAQRALEIEEQERLERDRIMPQALPQIFKDTILFGAQNRNVTEEKLVIQKQLFQSDLSITQNRLSIPFNQIISKDFLNEEEKEYLRRRDERGMMKLFKYVNIIDPLQNVGRVKLTRWDMNRTSSYALNGTWNQIKVRNNLTVGMIVQLWAFRIDEELWLALVTNQPPMN